MDRPTKRHTFNSLSSTAPEAKHEDFKPTFEWTEDNSNRFLLINLPGFERKDIRAQLNSAGTELLIKGSRQVYERKYLDVEQSFDVPTDTTAEKISGLFQDGLLTLILPKREVESQETMQKAVSEEEAKKASHEGKQPMTEEEKPKNTESAKDEPAGEKEKKREDSIQTGKVTFGEMQHEGEGKTIQNVKSKIRDFCADKTTEIRKRASKWRGSEDSWLNSGPVDDMLEKLNRNKKVIAVAVVAFSVGFYVSQKLRASAK